MDQYAEGLQDPLTVMTYLDEHPEVDIVLTDLILPNYNGWVLPISIKEKYPLMNVVLYSGDPVALQARPNGVPEPEELVEKIFLIKHLAELMGKLDRQKL